MTKPYKLAKPYRGKTGDPKDKWFAYYSFLNPLSGAFVRFKVYEGVNEIKDPKEKESYLNELIQEINSHLKNGYNPFEISNNVIPYVIDIEKEKHLLENPPTPTLLEAMEAFIKKKSERNNSKNSISTFRSYINNIERYLVDQRQRDINVTGFTEDFIYKMLSKLCVDIPWGATTYNNHLAFTRALVIFFCAKSQKWLKKEDYEFGEDKLEFKIAKVLKHQYFTDQITKVIKPEIEKDFALNIYANFLHFSCMRPDEIRNLKLDTVDIKSRTIKIIGKTNNRAIPISDELAKLLTSMNLENYPLDYYLIGSFGIPSSTRHKPDYFSKKFLAIRRRFNLSENLTLYGLKHSRIINLINAGFKDAEIQNLSGHVDAKSYEKYKRDLMGNMVSTMRGKTIEW